MYRANLLALTNKVLCGYELTEPRAPCAQYDTRVALLILWTACVTQEAAEYARGKAKEKEEGL